MPPCRLSADSSRQPCADTAIAALTCFPASILGAAFHTLFMSDSAKMIVNHRASLRSRLYSFPTLFPLTLSSPLRAYSALHGRGDQRFEREPWLPDHQPRHHSGDCLPRHERHGLDQVVEGVSGLFLHCPRRSLPPVGLSIPADNVSDSRTPNTNPLLFSSVTVLVVPKYHPYVGCPHTCAAVT